MVTPIGLSIIKSFVAAPFNSTTVEFIVDDSDTTPLFMNDPVKTINQTDDTGIDFCTKALPGNFLRGYVVGFSAEHDRENSVYRKASTRRKVRVCQDPFLLARALVNAAITDTDIGKYIDMDSGGGNVSTGISEVALDYATINDAAGQFKILQIEEVKADEGVSTVICAIAKHELLKGVAGSEDFWDRTGSTLIPHFSGDSVDLGAGDITATDAHFTGKLTVDGLIDPTALLLDGQATPPITDDGTIYYDSVTDKFLFRENGVWDDISSSNAWDRSGTTISVKNAGDDVDLSTAGLVKTATFDAANISLYNTHPTFTADTDVVDKKYVDEKLGLTGTKDVLTVSTPGQTAFTLSATPTNTDTMLAYVRGKFYDYGFGFTVIGTTLTWLDPEGLTLETTDRFIAIYDYDISGAPYNQYWQKISNTLSPVTPTDDVNVKNIQIGKTAAGTIDSKPGTSLTVTADNADLALNATGGGGDVYVTSTTGALKVDSSAPIEVTGTFDSTKPLTYDSYAAPTADAELAPKKYVDDHETNGIWQRSGTTVSVKNAGDDIDLSTAGLVQSGSFDSTNISSYDSHPTFSADTQLVDKKYVDDTHGGFLDQQQIYYVAKAGSDSNDGKSSESPFLTIAKAITEVTGQTPSSSNQFTIKTIGSAIWSETGLGIPTYTLLDIREGVFSGTITSMAASSRLWIGEVRATASTNSITVTGSGTRWIKIDRVNPATSGTLIFTGTSAYVHLDVTDLNMQASGAKAYSANTGSVIYLKCNKFKETTPSFNDGAARVFSLIEDKGSNADTEVLNQVGDIVIEANSISSKSIILKTISEVFSIQGVYPKWASTPTFVAFRNAPNVNATGDGTQHTILCNATAENIGTHYNTGTGGFSASANGMYSFDGTIYLSGLATASFNLLELYIRVAGTTPQDWVLRQFNPGPIRDTTAPHYFGLDFSKRLKLDGSDIVTVTLKISGSTKTITIQPGTSFTGRLETVL